MNPQSTWLHTLIEACGAHLLILALATAVSLLHGPPADAGGFGGPRAEQVAVAASGTRHGPEEPPRAPLRAPASVRQEKI